MPALWKIFRKTNLCGLRFRRGLSIEKRVVFMTFSAKTQKSTLSILEAQSNLNECKVKVPFHSPCCEESLETLPCAIWGLEVAEALRNKELSWFSPQELQKTFRWSARFQCFRALRCLVGMKALLSATEFWKRKKMRNFLGVHLVKIFF